jgi:polyhydroxyalkanoate synthesis repressor PhaR
MADTIHPLPAPQSGEKPPVVVKKYANRRLYNTESSCYITLDNLADMVRLGRDFVVYDAKSGEDITRGVLTQIIVEEEGKGRALLPTAFLRQLIGFYGDQMQSLVPRFLEQAMSALTQQQEQMRTAMQKTMGNLFPFGNIEEVGRQNMAIMERAFTMFTPFYRGGEAGDTNPPPDRSPGQALDPRVRPGDSPGQAPEVAQLRAEVESLRRQLEAARTDATVPSKTAKT